MANPNDVRANITDFSNVGGSNIDAIKTTLYSPFPLLPCALAGFAASNEWTSQTVPFRHWDIGSSSTKIAIGSGSGQKQSPFSVSLEHFVTECVDAGFSAQRFCKLSGKRSMFEHHFTFDEDAGRAASLELAVANYENDAFLLLLRLDFEHAWKRTRALIFLKLEDSLRSAPLSLDQFISYLDRNSSSLQETPLLVASTVLSFFQHDSFRYVEWWKELYDMESRLGVTRVADILKNSGYATVSFNYDRLNADLAWLARKTAESTLSASTILDHAKGLGRLAEFDHICQGIPPQRIFQMREEIYSTTQRAELFLKNMKMVDDVLQSMRAVLYNRISKHDSDSMKTIAVVTLVFLPATFVSSVFATGVFDFHATERDHRQVISSYGWIYLLVCILLTCLTLILWLCWYRWGSLWLEKLHLTRAHVDRQKGPRDARHISRHTSDPTTSNRGGDLEKGNRPNSTEGSALDPLDFAILVARIERIYQKAHEA